MCLEWAGKASIARLVLVGAGPTGTRNKVVSRLTTIVCQLRAVLAGAQSTFSRRVSSAWSPPTEPL